LVWLGRYHNAFWAGGTGGGSGGCDISARVAEFRVREQELIEAPDGEFRFHSGPPSVLAAA
jgi:tRNA isopentenyl-2-thiomethyl-A-37 hydroxylase MiaE